MDANATITDNRHCSICLNNAFHVRDDEGRYLGRTVKLDCRCNAFYHRGCILKFWNTRVSPTSTLNTDDLPLGERTVYEDMLVSGVNPDTFEFVDVPVKKAKLCPICSESVLEMTNSRCEPVLTDDSSALVDAPAKMPAPEVASEAPADAGASGPASNGSVAAKMGCAASIHNARAMVADLKKKGMIPTKLSVNDVDLLDFMNNKMADLDLKSREAEKILADFVTVPTPADFVTVPTPADQTTASSTVSNPPASVQRFRPCSDLTPAEIRDWVDAAKASGWIGGHVEVEIELLWSFIMFELAGRDFNSRRTQKRIIDFINSQATNRFRMPEVFF